MDAASVSGSALTLYYFESTSKVTSVVSVKNQTVRRWSKLHDHRKCHRNGFTLWICHWRPVHGCGSKYRHQVEHRLDLNKLCCEHRLEMARRGHIVGSLYRGGTGTTRARSGYESEELMQGGERNADSAGLQAEVVRLWGGQPSEHSRGEWVTLVPTLFSS